MAREWIEFIQSQNLPWESANLPGFGEGVEIKRLSEELMQTSHKLAEAMYAKASSAGQQGAGAAGAGAAGAGGPAGGGAADDDDVVDADFEEVKDDK